MSLKIKNTIIVVAGISFLITLGVASASRNPFERPSAYELKSKLECPDPIADPLIMGQQSADLNAVEARLSRGELKELGTIDGKTIYYDQINDTYINQ